jgi:gluconolactonase
MLTQRSLYGHVEARRAICAATSAAVLLLASASASAQGGTPLTERFFSIEQSAPGFEELIKSSAEWDLIGDRYGLTEGPVWVDDAGGAGNAGGGYLLFADLISNVIYKWQPNEGTTVFLDNAGYSGDDLMGAGTQTLRGRMHVLLIGPNGITLDREGRVVYCASPDRRIMRLEKDGRRTVVAETYQGMRFSGPNDLVYRSDGTLYFTETIWGLRGARDKLRSGERELPYTGVFAVKDGATTLVVNEQQLGGMPNGLAFSPDEKFLYVNGGDRGIMRYEMRPDGTAGTGTMIIAGMGSDGIKVDVKGNIYLTTGAGPGEVRIFSPAGVRLGTIKLPVSTREPQAQICATNIAFGDRDGKTLYITACEHVYRVRMEVEGIRPKPGTR